MPAKAMAGSAIKADIFQQTVVEAGNGGESGLLALPIDEYLTNGVERGADHCGDLRAAPCTSFGHDLHDLETGGNPGSRNTRVSGRRGHACVEDAVGDDCVNHVHCLGPFIRRKGGSNFLEPDFVGFDKTKMDLF